ncbi:MAG: hypothetical protein D6798_08495 [Deltaproteobacteria bacterium]|nr:MAG: hypothetical protein D6798_08495 [Deltaproteobacteria bacterium]
MRAFVLFRLPDGSSVELGHGDLIGRLRSAALPIADGRISEAHAMVSLRGQDLKLLALRGRFAVDGKPGQAVVLTAGQRIALAEGLSLVVEQVALPDAVFGVEGDGLPPVVVTGTSSLLTRPRPELVPRFLPTAPAHLWNDGEDWVLSHAGHTRSVRAGDEWVVDGRRFRGAAVALRRAGRSVTRLDGAFSRPLRVVARFETVHVMPDRGPPLALSGLAARLLSELVAFDGPVAWQVLARELWPVEDDEHLLRRKLDVNLSRLRRRLREASIRSDLVRSDGKGHVELFLHDGDTVEDCT